MFLCCRWAPTLTSRRRSSLTRGSVVFLQQQSRHVTLLGLYSWWRHQMDAVSALLAICAGNSLVTGEFPAQGPVTRSFDVFFALRLNGWVNNREAGDLRRHRAHYDDTVMSQSGRTSYPHELVQSRSREIDCSNYCITMNFDMHVDSAAAEVPVKFYNDWKSLNSLRISRLR